MFHSLYHHTDTKCIHTHWHAQIIHRLLSHWHELLLLWSPQERHPWVLRVLKTPHFITCTDKHGKDKLNICVFSHFNLPLDTFPKLDFSRFWKWTSFTSPQVYLHTWVLQSGPSDPPPLVCLLKHIDTYREVERQGKQTRKWWGQQVSGFSLQPVADMSRYSQSLCWTKGFGCFWSCYLVLECCGKTQVALQWSRQDKTRFLSESIGSFCCTVLFYQH